MEAARWRFAPLDALKDQPNIVAIKDLSRIWGIAKMTALGLVHKGYTSIASLRALNDRADGTDSTALRALLSPQQRVGLRHVEDIEARIPRAEVSALGAVVKRVARETFTALNPSAEAAELSVEIVGSYRRGALHSGDMDILICTWDTAVFFPILAKLNAIGFITDHLSLGKPHARDKAREFVDTAARALNASVDADREEGDRKRMDFSHFGKPKSGATAEDSTSYSWMGVVRLEGGVHRRVDIKVRT